MARSAAALSQRCSAILGVAREVVLLDAPSNLGLRPPVPGTVPGCYKLAGALRDQRLLERLRREGGVVVPPRYDRGDWQTGDGVFNSRAIASYTRRLADRLDGHLRTGEFPVVLGGDCSILLGSMFALRRMGRYALAFMDGHSDFRHVGNSAGVGAAAGQEPCACNRARSARYHRHGRAKPLRVGRSMSVRAAS